MGKPVSARKDGKSVSVQKKTPTRTNNGIKDPGLFAKGVGQLLGGAVLLGAIIGAATQPGGALVEKLGWPIIAATASYTLRLSMGGLRDMFEALDQVNKGAVVMLDMVQLALDIDIAVFTSADIVFHLATLGTLGQVVDANASLIGAIRAGVATEGGMAELTTMMGDTLGIVSGGSALNIQGDWQQLQADNR